MLSSNLKFETLFFVKQKVFNLKSPTLIKKKHIRVD